MLFKSLNINSVFTKIAEPQLLKELLQYTTQVIVYFHVTDFIFFHPVFR